MTEFDPPISSRETDELISIANSSTEYWQQEAIDQANAELLKRGITDEMQQQILDSWEEEERELQLAYQKQLLQNETEGYSIWLKIYIFFVAPIIFLPRIDTGLSPRELIKENFMKKYRQRQLLILGGVVFWLLVIIVCSLV